MVRRPIPRSSGRSWKSRTEYPMYANAWLGPQPNARVPGDWPSGGPVARVHDIWRAAAPSLDHLAPDIYVQDFKGTCALYVRSGNPLFIPEARDVAGNLFYALGRHSAMGWSPFGIEDLSPDGQVAQSYKLLREMLPQLADWQAAGKVTGVVVDGDQPETVELGGYRITAAPARGRGGPGGPGMAGGGRGGQGRQLAGSLPRPRRRQLRPLPFQPRASRRLSPVRRRVPPTSCPRCCPAESPRARGQCRPIRGPSR